MGLHEDMAAIKAKLSDSIRSALESEVAETAKAKMQEVLDAEVYSYEPSDFFESTRRFEDGGLRDKENMTHWVEDGDTLMVYNAAESQSLWEDFTRPLSVIVEEGLPNYVPGQIPFHSITGKELISSGDAEAALKKGLERQGIL